MRRLGCLAAALLLCAVIGRCVWYVIVEVPRAVVFQQVPESLAESRSYTGIVGEPCGAVIVPLSDDGAALIDRGGLEALNAARFTIGRHA